VSAAAYRTLDQERAPGRRLLQVVEPPRSGVDSGWHRTDLVTRRALIDTLQGSAGIRVVVVIAPAGSGKTTALRQWAGDDERPVAWIDGVPALSDPGAFERALAEAVSLALEGGPAAEIARSIGTSDPARSLSRLCREAAFDRRALLVVIDDVQELGDHPSLDLVALLADRMPDTWMLALGSRKVPSLPLARWRADRGMVELGFADLALDRTECTEALELLGLQPSSSTVDAVLAHTEGWAAGVHLAGLSLKAGRGRIDRLAVAGDEDAIRAYIESQMLAGLPPATLDMLVRTSIVDAVSGPLGDALTGRSGSGTRLHSLSRSNQLVFPLDAHRRWYRYHPLLRDVLTRRLEERSPGTRSAHRRAAAWFEAEGRLDDAIDHALLAGDGRNAVRLVTRAVQPAYRAGRLPLIRRWFSSFTTDDLARRPQLTMIAALVSALEGDPLDAMKWAAATERRSPNADGGRDRRGLDRSILQAVLCRRNPEAMLVDADIALEAHDEDWSWRPTALLAAGEALAMLGDAAAAQARFAEAELAPEIGASTARFSIRAERAFAAIGRRRWPEVDDILAMDRPTFHAEPEAGRLTGLLWLVADARLAIHRGDLRAAGARIRQAQAGGAWLSWAIPWYAVRTLSELARAQLLLGDAPGAIASLREARRTVEARPRLGNLPANIDELSERAVGLDNGALPAGSTLTPAELRLLPLLQTYLTFKEIGQRLTISSNTVKTEAMSIYAKLGAASRGEAVVTAVRYGLLEDILA
jgi:LuxR family maltose regulon positive regulatory protein